VRKTGSPPNGGIPGPLVPELPDVEGFRRVLSRHAKGKRIESVEVIDRSMLSGSSPQALGRALKGRRFREPRRHGKWVIAPVGDVEVLMHFGMTGLLEWRRRGEERHRHDRIVFACEGGELSYRNMRKFGSVRLARDESERERVIGRLGPDAASLDKEGFLGLLGRRRGSIKAALMDQSLLAGVGNLLSDEILWRARVNPRTPVPRISRHRRERLYQALRDTIRESVPTGRVPHGERWLTRIRDERDPRCPRCGTRLRKATVAGRTACWCPRDQRR
jgi:formamidopyrimidine-DNA glycosylase